MSRQRLFALSLLLCASASAADPLTDGVNHLLTQRGVDGAFGVAAGEEPIVVTSEAVLALRAVGLGANFEALEAERYLSSTSTGADSELALRQQRALGSSVLAVPFVALNGHAPGFDADDAAVLAHALLVLKSRGQALSGPGLNFARRLAALQNPLGCFAAADNAPSPELTATAALALSPFQNSEFQLQVAHGGALGCLSAVQHPDGSFGGAAATALALSAAQEASFAPGPLLLGSRQALIGAQLSNGSWGTVRATSLALQALAGGGLDWRVPMAFFDLGGFGGWIGVVTLTPSTVEKGNTFVATVPVTNASNVSAPATTVNLIARPRLVGNFSTIDFGDFAVPALGPGQTFNLTVPLPSDGFQATQFFIYATVDPHQLFPDVNRSNNTARGTLTVNSKNDLEVTSGSFTLANGAPGQVQLTAQVRNLGQPTPVAVTVELFRGGRTGTLLATAVIPAGLPSSSNFPISATFATASLNGPTPFEVFVDFANVLPEASEDNNQATRWYDAAPATGGQDLFTTNVQVPTVQPVRSGQQYTVTFQVGNNSTKDVSNVPVSINVEGTITRTTIDLLPASAVRTITLSNHQNFRSTSIVIYAQVDPDRVLNDPNRGNDAASVGMQTSQAGVDDLALNNFVASALVDGALNVTNYGNHSVDTLVVITNVLTGTEVTRTAVQLNAGELRTLRFAGLGSGALPLVAKACVDPFNAFAEANENDNCATLTYSQGTYSNLRLKGGDFTLTPPGADVGEKVHAEVRVVNVAGGGGNGETQVPGRGVVEWWQGRPGYREGQKLGETPFVIAAGASAQVPFDFLRRPGAPELYARLTSFQQHDIEFRDDMAGVHLFFERAVSVRNGSVTDPYTTVTRLVRSGRLSGAAEPELVVGLEQNQGTTLEVIARQPNGTFSSVWRVNQASSAQLDAVLLDADADGTPELFHLTQGLATPQSVRLVAYTPTGQVKWQTQWLGGPSSTLPSCDVLGFGDVNGDGTTDLVVFDSALRVFSGADGAEIRHTDIDLPGSSVPPTQSVYVLDVDLDGTNEILAVRSNGDTILFSSTGAVRWRRGLPPTNGIVDLDLDGFPELLASRVGQQSGVTGSFGAVDLRTGNLTVASTVQASTGFAAGALRQNGLRYPAASPFIFGFNITAVGPDLSFLWGAGAPEDTGGDFSQDNPIGTFADLTGAGRPQLLALSSSQFPLMVDGRDGRALLTDPTGNHNEYTYPLPPQVPVVAALSADGVPRVVIPHPASDDNRTDTVSYGNAEALIFSSPHWTNQTRTAWPTHNLVQGRIGEDLKMATGDAAYRWWRTHNTYNQQFLSTPETLLADLAISAGPQNSATAGQPFTLAATLKNVGGLPASNIVVSLYDRDPAAGGVQLGTTTVPGPLAVRTGTAPVQLTWANPSPVGLQTLFLVANPGSAIAESGRENNSLEVKVLVNAPTLACDLRVVPSSLAANPTAPVGGDQLTLTGTVENVGSVACTPSSLQVHDGLAASATVFGSAVVPGLAPGATTQVVVPGVALEGQRQYLFVANADQGALDPNPSNDSAALEVMVGSGTQADLAAELVRASPVLAYAGEALTLTLTVRNRGLLSSPTSVRFVTPGLTVDAALAALGPGEATDISVTVPAPAASGAFTATVDPDHLVAEFDESNNTATGMLVVAPAPITLTLVATPSTAGAQQPIALALTVGDPTSQDAAPQVAIDILDAAGATVATPLPARTAVVSAGGTVVVPATWNTGTSAAGAYVARARATVVGRVVAEGKANLTVLSQTPVTSALAVDRARYRPSDAVTFTERISNDSVNSSLVGATATLTVREPQGAILSVATRVMTSLGPTTAATFYDVFRLAALASPGIWSGRLEVHDAQGMLVAQSQAFFELDFTASQTVTGDATAPALIQIGQPLPVSVVLTNTGSLNLTNGQLEVLLLNASGATLSAEASALQPVSVLSGQSATFGASLPTVGLSTGPKLVLVRLDGRVVDTVAVDVVTSTDTEPPIIQITGVADNALTRVDVLPVVTILDASAFTSLEVLDGAPWNGASITSEGLHLFTVNATDVFGNFAQATVRFTIDKTPPALTLFGVADGALVNAAVTLTFSAQDAHPGTTTSTLNGAPFNSGDSVTADGTWVWTVTSTDAAGNTATETRTFVVDRTPPSLVVSGVTEGAYRNAPVTVSWVAQDANGVVSLATLDGVPLSNGATVSSVGAHTLVVTATDAAGNTTAVTVHFTLDFTAPTLQLFGVADGAHISTAVTLTWTAADASPVTTIATLNGLPIASGQVVNAQGAWVWVVTATDAAGNVASQTRSFVLDTGFPVITIFGVTNGELRSTSFTPTWTVQDDNLASQSATLDGAPFNSGDTVSSEGDHLLVVTARDLSGNTSVASRSFSVDRTLPVLTQGGIANGGFSNVAVTLTFSATDAHPGVTTSTLDGVAFASGGVVSAEGSHSWVVRSTDAAGNTASQTRTFTVDFTAPAVAIGGVASGAYYRTPQSPTFTATDLNLDTVTATLDGVAFVSGTAVGAAGTHTLVVRATDKSGNVTVRAVSFTIDVTAPVITVVGVTDGASAASFTITFSAVDASPVTIAATLDGSPFASGGTVSQAGAHVLDVDATDAAGNTASRTISFSVVAGGQCLDRTLVARRTYRPTRWTDAFLKSSVSFGFALPQELQVSVGNASKGWATIIVKSGNQSAVCKYEGQSPKDHPTKPGDVAAGLKYRFHHCTDGGRFWHAGDTVNATELVLHVHDGDDQRGPTEVSWGVVERRPCTGGTVQSGTRPGHHKGRDDDDDDGHGGHGHGHDDGDDHGDDHDGDCHGDHDDDHGGHR